MAMSNDVFQALSRGLIGAESRNRNNNRNRKKNKNGKGRNKIFARCESQLPACEALIQQNCGDDAACLAADLPCCEQLEICEFTAFIACINAASN
jgi:hypothetical protein